MKKQATNIDHIKHKTNEIVSEKKKSFNQNTVVVFHRPLTSARMQVFPFFAFNLSQNNKTPSQAQKKNRKIAGKTKREKIEGTSSSEKLEQKKKRKN